ncbi:MAG TPA: DNA-deoxyinosine glycosylase [bacterium]|nr:DNA-deoxyinosine glycosylase [bacterium]
MCEKKLTGFPAVVGKRPTILILGSMPGERSLTMREYYGHPQNSFWRIMGTLCGAVPELPYEQRLAALKRHGIALWDVLKHCERIGSGDGDIRRESEVPNAIGDLLRKHPTIRAVALNGGKARQAFRRHIWPTLPDAVTARLTILELPSTSPACAMISYKEKLHRWREVERFLRSTRAEG